VWRFNIWKLVNSKAFEYGIMVMIILNMIQLACNYEDSPAYWELMLRISNYIFTAVFFVEAVLNIYAYGWSYFQTSWNKFDFFVVAASLIDLALEFIGTEAMEGLPIGNIAKILRVLRVSRVLRLASKSKDLQALI
jgi:voltage-dependent calcium channel L type alpha-1D